MTVYVNFQKSSGTVCHERLLKRVNCCGTKEKAFIWMRNLLCYTRPRVEVNDAFPWRTKLSTIVMKRIICKNLKKWLMPKLANDAGGVFTEHAVLLFFEVDQFVNNCL